MTALASLAALLVAVPLLLWWRHVPAPAATMRTATATVAVPAPRMLKLAGGAVSIGAAAPDARSNEYPRQQLVLAEFSMAAEETSVGEFARFVAATAYRNPHWSEFPCEGDRAAEASWEHPGYAQDGSYPVVCVSAADARAYADWLSVALGQHYRLPTEAQLEYAIRGGTHGPFWWGDGAEQALCAGCAGKSLTQPVPADAGPINPYGLRNITGNVREWTCSRYTALDTGAFGTCVSEPDVELAVRGGAWNEPPAHLRSSYRSYLSAQQRDIYTGFRLVLDAAAPQ